MFTITEIDKLHARLGKQSALYEYLKALNAIGVLKFDSFLTDGHSEYYGDKNYKVSSPAVHETYQIAPNCNRENFLTHLELHKQGKTTYFEMARGLADSGIAKWTFDTERFTLAYFDLIGNEILFEEIR